eukprot:514342_1
MSVSSYYGITSLHLELEQKITNFIYGNDEDRDAIISGMGWATNVTTIYSLLKNSNSLIISDSLNHNSIAIGAKSAGIVVQVFEHQNMNDLENIIICSNNIYDKILIIVEGVYSMEGTTCNLPKIVELKEKYNCYLYVDEAHSIGAIGKNGRGICEYYNISPNRIDILMGTFTKSFGSIGGYITGNKKLITQLRINNISSYFSSGLSIPCMQQIISALKIIDSDIGRRKIENLHKNSDYMRKIFLQNGLIVYGEYGIPILPIFIGDPQKCQIFSRKMLQNGIAVTVVGYPATDIFSSRVRMCVSSKLTKKQINKIVDSTLKVANEIGLCYNHRLFG